MSFRCRDRLSLTSLFLHYRACKSDCTKHPTKGDRPYTRTSRCIKALSCAAKRDSRIHILGHNARFGQTFNKSSLGRVCRANARSAQQRTQHTQSTRTRTESPRVETKHTCVASCIGRNTTDLWGRTGPCKARDGTTASERELVGR